MMGSSDEVLTRVAEFTANMTKDLQERAMAEEESKIYRREKLEKERSLYESKVAARQVAK